MRRGAAVAAFGVLLATALAAAFGLAGWPGGPGTPGPRGVTAVPVPGFPSGLSLLVSAEDAGQVAAVASGLARRIIGGQATLVLGPPPAPAGQAAEPAAPPGRASLGAVYTSYATFRRDLAGGQIPAGVKAVSYDPVLVHRLRRVRTAAPRARRLSG